MINQETSCSFDLISHTDRTLKTHLRHCDDISQIILSNKFISRKLIKMDNIQDIIKLLVYFHDFGKSTDFFQFKIIEATMNDNHEFAEIHKDYIDCFVKNKNKLLTDKLSVNDRLSHHAQLGAYFQFGNYKSADPIINLIMLEITKRHHSYLRNFEKGEFWLNAEINFNLSNIREQINHINYNAYLNIVSELNFTVNKVCWNDIIDNYSKGRGLNNTIESLKEIKDIKYFFLQHFLFSVLLSADKGDMMLKDIVLIKPNNLFKSDLIDKYIKDNIKSDKTIDNLRKDAYNNIIINFKKHSDSNFYSITLPTGLGKTFCAYNTAFHLQNSIKDFHFRIVYCLPFTSIIDQNEKVLSDIFKHNNVDLSLICKHHHLSDYKEEYREEEITYSEAEYLTEGWEQEFIVTTFVQLLESIFTNKNRSLRKFHNLVNSIIILDEVQNIPPKYFNLLEVTFKKMAEYFGTIFIFVTATQPILFQDSEIILELTDPKKKKTKEYFLSMDRIVMDISLFKNGITNDDDIINTIQKDINDNPDKSFLIIVNTIKQSQLIYYSLQSKHDKYYLSASILPIFRKNIIEIIKSSSSNKIVVSTQVVEAGVDIDLDIVYRDFAPLDSLNQSAGRCNRNGLNAKGLVKIFNSGKAQCIYDSTLLDITKIILLKQNDMIQEKDFYYLNYNYYKEVKSKVQDFNDISKTLLSYMYELQLEKLESEFKLIEDLPIYYNVFIPFNKESKSVWREYLRCFKENNNFKRKELIKKIKPQVLQYVTIFPKNKYSPPNSQDKNKLIYAEDWEKYYNLLTGFIYDKSDNKIVML